MRIKESLENDLREALRARDAVQKSTLRMALSAIKLAEIEKKHALDDTAVQAVLQSEVKSRWETIAEAKAARRMDIVEAAQSELEILQKYLPKLLSEEEIRLMALDVIREVGASSPGDMGVVMKTMMPKLRGRADGKLVSQIVRQLLSEDRTGNNG
jgi:uncharacterized protein YqeY